MVEENKHLSLEARELKKQWNIDFDILMEIQKDKERPKWISYEEFFKNHLHLIWSKVKPTFKSTEEHDLYNAKVDHAHRFIAERISKWADIYIYVEYNNTIVPLKLIQKQFNTSTLYSNTSPNNEIIGKAKNEMRIGSMNEMPSIWNSGMQVLSREILSSIIGDMNLNIPITEMTTDKELQLQIIEQLNSSHLPTMEAIKAERESIKKAYKTIYDPRVKDNSADGDIIDESGLEFSDD